MKIDTHYLKVSIGERIGGLSGFIRVGRYYVYWDKRPMLSIERDRRNRYPIRLGGERLIVLAKDRR